MSLDKSRGFQSGQARMDTAANAASVAETLAPVFPNRERGEPSSFGTIAHRRRTNSRLGRHHAADMPRCHHRADARVEFQVGSNRARIVPAVTFGKKVSPRQADEPPNKHREQNLAASTRRRAFRRCWSLLLRQEPTVLHARM